MVAPHRALAARDFDAALTTLADAFAEDPVWGRGGWAFPDAAQVAQLRRDLFAVWLREAMALDSVRIVEGCDAVALWYPPGAPAVSDEYLRALQGLSTRLGAHAPVFLRGAQVFAEAQPAGGRFWYLALLAAHPRRRGHGVGMGLLRGCLEAPEFRAAPTYIESTNPRNTPRYRQIGFTELGTLQLPDGPAIMRMWRDLPANDG